MEMEENGMLTWAHLSEKCERLREVFCRLRYPNHLIDSVINRFITSRVAVDQPKQSDDSFITRLLYAIAKIVYITVMIMASLEWLSITQSVSQHIVNTL